MPNIFSDPVRLRQILYNVAGNAIKFTSQGEVRLSLILEEAGDQLKTIFQVSDTGRGITEEETEKLFTSFSSGRYSKKDYGRGTGLGLYISRILARHMGGDIKLISSSKEGSVFKINLNLGLLG